MKRWRVLITIVMAIILAGCDTTSQARLEILNDLIENAQTLGGQFDAKMAALDASLLQAQTMLSDPAINPELAEDISGQIDKMREEAQRIAADKARIEGAVAAWQAGINAILANPETDITGELEAWGQGAAHAGSLLPPPYNGYLYLGGIILTTVGGILGGGTLQKRKGVQTENALTETVRSVDALLSSIENEAGPDVSNLVSVKGAKKILKANQSNATRDVVRKVKAA